MSSLVTIRAIIDISWISNKQLIRRILGLPGCESLVGLNGLWGHCMFALAVDWKWAAENLCNQLQCVNIVTAEHSMGHLKEELLVNALSYYVEQLASVVERCCWNTPHHICISTADSGMITNHEVKTRDFLICHQVSCCMVFRKGFILQKAILSGDVHFSDSYCNLVFRLDWRVGDWMESELYSCPALWTN